MRCIAIERGLPDIWRRHNLSMREINQNKSSHSDMAAENYKENNAEHCSLILCGALHCSLCSALRAEKVPPHYTTVLPKVAKLPRSAMFPTASSAVLPAPPQAEECNASLQQLKRSAMLLYNSCSGVQCSLTTAAEKCNAPLQQLQRSAMLPCHSCRGVQCSLATAAEECNAPF